MGRKLTKWNLLFSSLSSQSTDNSIDTASVWCVLGYQYYSTCHVAVLPNLKSTKKNVGIVLLVRIHARVSTKIANPPLLLSWEQSIWNNTDTAMVFVMTHPCPSSSRRITWNSPSNRFSVVPIHKDLSVAHWKTSFRALYSDNSNNNKKTHTHMKLAQKDEKRSREMDCTRMHTV